MPSFTIKYTLTDYEAEMLERARQQFNKGEVADCEDAKESLEGMMRWCLREQVRAFINGEENEGANELGVEFGLCTPEQKKQLRAMFKDGKGKRAV
jgi:hypothetical protein